MSWAIWAGLIAVHLLALFLIRRRNERHVRETWRAVTSDQQREALGRSVGRDLDAGLAQVDAAYDRAHELHEVGSVAEARDLLKTGLTAIDRFVPSLLGVLTTTTIFSRMVLAMAPLPAMKGEQFRLTSLRGLAAAARVLHQFALASGERFRLRLFVLRQGIGLVARHLVRATGRILSGRRVDREWEQISLVREDMHAIVQETVASFHALLQSLPAEHLTKVVDFIEQPDDGEMSVHDLATRDALAPMNVDPSSTAT